MSLIYIGQQITIYVGSFLVIIGVIGNGINILVFSSVRTYRTAPCTFYFLIASIFNIAYITINLISRITSESIGIDLTQISPSWCKIREFSLVTLSSITLTCSCLATIDQFFATSQIAKLRHLSNIKWSHRIVIIMIIVWCLHGIPVLLFYNISPITKSCGNTNSDYAIYSPIYLLGLICGIPVLIMVIFAYLTNRNIHMTRALAQQQADRQLTKMIFIQVLLVVICIVPYGINLAYLYITSGVNKDLNRLINEFFALTILSLLPYFYFAGGCYMFLISSSRFRRTTKHRILFCFRPNQVGEAQQRTDTRATLNSRSKR